MLVKFFLESLVGFQKRLDIGVGSFLAKETDDRQGFQREEQTGLNVVNAEVPAVFWPLTAARIASVSCLAILRMVARSSWLLSGSVKGRSSILSWTESKISFSMLELRLYEFVGYMQLRRCS